MRRLLLSLAVIASSLGASQVSFAATPVSQDAAVSAASALWSSRPSNSLQFVTLRISNGKPVQQKFHRVTGTA